MFDEDQQKTPVRGVTVSDAVVAIQVIDRAFARGVINGNEAKIVADARTNLIAGVEKVTEVNYDKAQAEQVARAQAQAAQQARQAAMQAQAAPAPAQAEVVVEQDGVAE